MRVIYHLTSGGLQGVAEEARWAESVGYDGITSSETGHDPFLPLALAAGATSRVTLDTRVAIAFPRSPMVVAYTARDLQDYSGGRFRLGLGTQVKGHIERRFSTDWTSPGPRLREYVQSLRAIWECWQTGEKLAFHGDHYNFSLMTPFFSPGPSPVGPPPVHVSALNPYNCRVAGEVCDGLSLHPITSAKYLTEAIRPNVLEGARRAGRSANDVSINGGGFVVTGPNAKAIAAEKEVVRRRIAFYFSTRTYFPVLEAHGIRDLGQRLHEMSLKGQWDRMTGLVTDEVLDLFAMEGGYDEVAGMLKGRFGGLLDEIMLGVGGPASPAQDAIEKIIDELKG